MNNGSDWSQLFPDIIAGLVVALIVGIVGSVVAYSKSEKFRGFVLRIIQSLKTFFAPLSKKLPIGIVLGVLVSLDIIIGRMLPPILLSALIILNVGIGILLTYLFPTFRITLPFRRRKKPGNVYFKALPIRPGLGNVLIRDRYLDFPVGKVDLGGMEFLFDDDALLFDTAGQQRFIRRGKGGSREIDFSLPESIPNIRNVNFLINSGNSREIYRSQIIGEIKLLFKGIPDLTYNIVLGENVREWCIGNPGKYVRDVSNPNTFPVWKGTNIEGANVVVDCLRIEIPEALLSERLKKIVFSHTAIPIPPDEIMVHYSVLGVSLEIDLS